MQKADKPCRSYFSVFTCTCIADVCDVCEVELMYLYLIS